MSFQHHASRIPVANRLSYIVKGYGNVISIVVPSRNNMRNFVSSVHEFITDTLITLFTFM